MYEQIARNKRRTVLYVVLFCLVWLGIGAAVGGLYAAASAPSSTGGSDTASDVMLGVVVAALFAAAAVAFSLLSGTRVVLAVAGARLADPVAYRQLYDLVEALSMGDGLPMPAVYVVDDPSPNAFATGTSPAKAAVTVTSGLLELMNREELEGVLAHELSHVKNYDTRLLLVVSTLIGLAALLASVIWRSAFFMRSRGRNGAQLMIVVLGAGVILTIVGFVVGPLVRLALSRRRESLADASGVELCRNPAGLISALRKLESDTTPLARVNHVTATMCINDPMQHHETRWQHLFDTHPPLADRIAILERMQQGLSV